MYSAGWEPGKACVIYSSSEKPTSPRSSCFVKRQTYHLDTAAMGALGTQEDKSSAQASFGPISVCVLCCFIQACSQAKSSWLGATRRQYWRGFLLPSRPMTFHNVIVVSHLAAEHRTRVVELALLSFHLRPGFSTRMTSYMFYLIAVL